MKLPEVNLTVLMALAIIAYAFIAEKAFLYLAAALSGLVVIGFVAGLALTKSMKAVLRDLTN